MKNKLMWFFYSWDSVMNLKYNPLRFIGDVSLQCYYMIVLSILWTLAFCGLIAGWTGVIPLLAGHVGILFAIFFTYAIFYDARKGGSQWFADWNSSYNMHLAHKNKDRSKNACKWDLEHEA